MTTIRSADGMKAIVRIESPSDPQRALYYDRLRRHQIEDGMIANLTENLDLYSFEEGYEVWVATNSVSDLRSILNRYYVELLILVDVDISELDMRPYPRLAHLRLEYTRPRDYELDLDALPFDNLRSFSIYDHGGPQGHTLSMGRWTDLEEIRYWSKGHINIRVRESMVWYEVPYHSFRPGVFRDAHNLVSLQGQMSLRTSISQIMKLFELEKLIDLRLILLNVERNEAQAAELIGGIQLVLTKLEILEIDADATLIYPDNFQNMLNVHILTLSIRDSPIPLTLTDMRSLQLLNLIHVYVGPGSDLSEYPWDRLPDDLRITVDRVDIDTLERLLKSRFLTHPVLGQALIDAYIREAPITD